MSFIHAVGKAETGRFSIGLTCEDTSHSCFSPKSTLKPGKLGCQTLVENVWSGKLTLPYLLSPIQHGDSNLKAMSE